MLADGHVPHAHWTVCFRWWHLGTLLITDCLRATIILTLWCCAKKAQSASERRSVNYKFVVVHKVTSFPGEVCTAGAVNLLHNQKCQEEEKYVHTL